jgi:hypothetical protein
MGFKTINDYPENTSPSGEWYVLVDNGTGCYYKVKIKNLPGGGGLTTSTTTTSGGISTTSTTTTSVPVTTSTTTTGVPITTSTTTTVSYDPDAQAFFTAIEEDGGSLTLTEKSAINTMVVDFKADGLWTKLKAIYPFVGGSAIAHKYNLKNPVNNDAAFRMVFNGGVTHNGDGVTFNGTTGYGDTKFAIEDFTSDTSLSYGVYIRTIFSASNGGFDFGVYGGGARAMIWANARRFYPNAGQIASWTAYGASEPLGFIEGCIRGLADVEAYKNGVSASTGVTANDTIPTNGQPWYLGAVNLNNGTAGDFTNHNYAFAYLGDELDDTESGNLYTIVQACQTTLGRQV